MTLVEQSREAGRATDAVVLQAVVDAGDLGTTSPRIRETTGLPDRTVRNALVRLVDRRLITRQSQRGPVAATAAGRAEAGANLIGLGTTEALDAALARLPSEALRAFVRSLLSGTVARHHLRRDRPSGWLGFLACGPTGTGKTLAAEITCRVFGLNREATVRLVESETERSLWGRREGSGAATTLQPAEVLGYTFLCLDELDKAPGALRVATLKLLQGETRVAGEGSQVIDVAPTVLATHNGSVGLVPEEYRRRCMVLDTGPIVSLLTDLDEVAHDLLAPGVLPRLGLDAMAPPVHQLPDGVRLWTRSALREGLTDDGWRMLNMAGVESLALGRAALTGDGDLRRAAAATAADYLTCAYLIGEAFAGLPDELRAVLGGPLAPDAQTAALERERLEETARQRRLARETAQLELIGARAAVAGRLSAAAAAIMKAPPRSRDEAVGVRGQLGSLREHVLRSRNREHLEELAALAEPVMARADGIAQEVAGERALAADTEAALRETKHETRSLDDEIRRLRRYLDRGRPLGVSTGGSRSRHPAHRALHGEGADTRTLAAGHAHGDTDPEPLHRRAGTRLHLRRPRRLGTRHRPLCCAHCRTRPARRAAEEIERADGDAGFGAKAHPDTGTSSGSPPSGPRGVGTDHGARRWGCVRRPPVLRLHHSDRRPLRCPRIRTMSAPRNAARAVRAFFKDHAANARLPFLSIIAVSLAACSAGIASPTSDNGTGSIGSGYLATSSTEVAFIQLSQHGRSLLGTEDAAVAVDQPPQQQVSVSSISVTGSLQGSGVSLSFEGSPARFGHIANGRLNIEIPQSDGSLANFTFNEATVAQYDSALATLRGAIATGNAQVATKEAEEHQIDQTASVASGDISTLNDTSFSEGLGQLQSDAQQVQSDLGAEEGYYATFQSDLAAGNQFGQACTDVGGTLNAQLGGSIGGYIGGVFTIHVQQLQSGIQSLRQTRQTAPADVRAYQEAQAKLPDYRPSQPVGDLQSALVAAQTAIATAITAGNQLVDQVNGYVAQATQLTSQANSAADCGDSIDAPGAVQNVA